MVWYSGGDVTHVEIPHDSDDQRIAYRPPAYGRANIIEFTIDGDNAGLLDVKGVGLHPFMNYSHNGNFPYLMEKKIDHGNHSDGLLKMGEGIRESLYEQLVNRIFLHSKTNFYTVGTYAVLDPGFDVISDKGDKDRAALYIRQAHDRKNPFDKSWEGNAWPELETRQTIADLLEIYGLTARRDPEKGKQFERKEFKKGELSDSVNVQTTRDERGIMDFGHYTAYRKPGLTEDIIATNFDDWGYKGDKPRDGFNHSLDDNPAKFTYALIKDLYNKEGTWNEKRTWIHNHFRTMLSPFENKVREKDNSATLKHIGFSWLGNSDKLREINEAKNKLKKNDKPAMEFSGREMAEIMRKPLNIHNKDLSPLTKVWDEKNKSYYNANDVIHLAG